MTAFLGVSASATGRKWVGLSENDDRLAQSIAQQTGLPATLARTLARLGVAAENATAYLAPSLRDLMPNPSIFRDMDTAAERITQAIAKHQTIAIFADYDVDGGSSAALLIDYLRNFNIPATLFVPDRIDEGYGPNEPAMADLAARHDLIICVDCGTLSHDAIAAAKGADVIVLDHHMGGETLPPALAVVNPNRQDEDSEFGNLCAAGVVFLTLVAVNRNLRENGEKTPDLMALLDLVALATVADVAPLTGLNRALVRQGLKVMGQRNRVGLAALSDAARLTSAPNSYHLGFALGPRINAGGRIGKADLGARLLATTNPDEAQAMADQLSQLNDDRREIEAQVRLLAMEQAEERGFDAPLVWAAGKNWHPGVVGIVASRLKETSNRPAIVIGLEGGEGKGSGRSVTGIDLGSAIATCAREGLLLKGGGHKMAAGLTVAEDKLEAAMDRLGELLRKQGADKIGPKDLRLDGSVMPSAITTELVEQLEMAGPFGAGAPAPRFALPAQKIAFAKRAGESHLRLTAQDANGGRIDAICFGAFDGPIGPMLENHKGQSFHLAGRLEIDEWGGRRKAKLRLEDVAPAE
ncbi:single-stranded-DNA-specific exonuclease RecJ [Amylibacter sp. IMCC11727]|uniref:single-stranded-DNA-specific exonuclease RecJ n=1 Tax=Amylibacter sp. IMCC11727 TaxID=3039851 RepID=UPI00244D9A11|nr:single-stranded-DNA-specific exonuclease RecJ [Amylibacter sp. IMCC11727]WGI22688.1 single-stranded-DNA-specific exonuclease RecJ [Amylibacter sp. IMCC11727]